MNVTENDTSDAIEHIYIYISFQKISILFSCAGVLYKKIVIFELVLSKHLLALKTSCKYVLKKS